MSSGQLTSYERTEQSSPVAAHVPLAMQIGWTACFLLWRGYYFLTVVIIPSMGWR